MLKIFFVFSIIHGLIFVNSAAAGENYVPENIMAARNNALEWLYSQIVPNAKIKRPAPLKTNLVAGFDVPKSDPLFRFIFSRSYIYDNALAVIAFTMAGDYETAEKILTAMQQIINKDGSYWFAYNTHNLWPSDTNNTGAIIRTGAIAWAGYSAVYHLLKRKEKDPGFNENNPFAQEITALAEKIAAYITERQVIDKNNMQYSLVTGGKGNAYARFDEKTGTYIESHNLDEITWVSVEHNIDSWFFLRDLGKLTGNSKYEKSADLIKEGLMRMWSDRENQFYQGISREQVIDKTLPLDGASWGALFLSSSGEERKAVSALEAVERNFKTVSGNYNGYGPYYRESIQIESGKQPVTWKDLQIVWSEGTLGVAAAYIRIGNKEKAVQIISDIIKMKENGSLLYASDAVPHQFNTYPSTAGTAWLVIAVQMLIDDKEIFWGK